MITNIHLKNFKCFDDINMELRPLNLFAGENSAGKSSFIQSILLLRQSFDSGCINDRLVLNGNLTQIGTGKDLMYRHSNDDYFVIDISLDEINYKWKYKYCAEADIQEVISGNSGDRGVLTDNIFSRSFSFIPAERSGPKRFYQAVDSFGETIKGNDAAEQAISFLVQNGSTYHVDNQLLIDNTAGSDLLIYQVQAWLSKLGMKLNVGPNDYKDIGIVGLEYMVGTEPYKPINIGFGVTYVLPIIVSMLKAKRNDLVILENPEAHLHPKAQRIIGEMMAEAAAWGVQVIVETHSDHVLNGIRIAVKNKKIDKDDVRLSFFYQTQESEREPSQHKKTSPAILEDGRLSNWPDGFFDEWDKAMDELLWK